MTKIANRERPSKVIAKGMNDSTSAKGRQKQLPIITLARIHSRSVENRFPKTQPATASLLIALSGPAMRLRLSGVLHAGRGLASRPSSAEIVATARA
jgi:hypothetical protein